MQDVPRKRGRVWEVEGVTTTWNDAKNDRRCELIDKEVASFASCCTSHTTRPDIEGTLSSNEKDELAELQNQMLAYRRKVAPLPMEAAGAVLQKAAQRANERPGRLMRE